MKKICAFMLAAIMMFSLSVSAVAIEPIAEKECREELKFGDPIKVINYVDEQGNDVVEEIYFAPDNGVGFGLNGRAAVMAETEGRGWYQKKAYINNTQNKAAMYVKAYFVWGNGNVSVSNASGWYEGLPSATTVSNEDVNTGTGRFAVVFNKYAYAEYSFTSTNAIGISQSNKVKVTVSESGNVT